MIHIFENRELLTSKWCVGWCIVVLESPVIVLLDWMFASNALPEPFQSFMVEICCWQYVQGGGVLSRQWLGWGKIKKRNKAETKIEKKKSTHIWNFLFFYFLFFFIYLFLFIYLFVFIYLFIYLFNFWGDCGEFVNIHCDRW